MKDPARNKGKAALNPAAGFSDGKAADAGEALRNFLLSAPRQLTITVRVPEGIAAVPEARAAFLDEAVMNAVREAYKTQATKGEGLVENPENTAYNAGMDSLKDYLKSLGVPQSRQPELAAKIDAFAKAEITGREAAPAAAPSFAAALEAMTLKERRAALDAHYADRAGNQWSLAKGKTPTPEKFRAWLDAVFPDRREIGMVLSDLRHLDEAAYDKVMLWAGKRSKVARVEIDAFGLPSKTTKYDAVRDADAPKSLNEIVERAARGEGTFKNLHRSYIRARYHAATP